MPLVRRAERTDRIRSIADAIVVGIPLLATCLLFACASRTRLAPEAAWPESITALDVSSSLVVPYPPPVTKIETVPPAPSDPRCLYLDGHWTFGGKDWQWMAGTWLLPPRGCAFARPRLFWHELGGDRSELRLRPGRWVQASDLAVECPAAIPCSAVSTAPPS